MGRLVCLPATCPRRSKCWAASNRRQPAVRYSAAAGSRKGLVANSSVPAVGDTIITAVPRHTCRSPDLLAWNYVCSSRMKALVAARRPLVKVQEYCKQVAQAQKIANSVNFRRPYTGCTTRPSDRVSSVIRSGSSLSEATSRQVLQPTIARTAAAVTTTTKQRRCCTPQKLCCLVEHQV